MAEQAHVHHAVAAIAADLGGTVGVAARNLASQASVTLTAGELFPMASCFKIPVMVEVMRQVDAGAIRLRDWVTLTEADKSPGSTLIHCHEGLRPSVRDLLYLMITLSDNTATDMLWRLVGLGAVNDTMARLGLTQIDCFMPDREYFLMECGAGSDWRGLSGAEIVARWREFEKGGRHEEAFARPRGERPSQRRELPARVRPALGPRRITGLRRRLRDRPGAGQSGLPRRHGGTAGDDRRAPLRLRPLL